MGRVPHICAVNGGWRLCFAKRVDGEDGRLGNRHVDSGKGGRRSLKKQL